MIVIFSAMILCRSFPALFSKCSFSEIVNLCKALSFKTVQSAPFSTNGVIFFEEGILCSSKSQLC